MQPCVYTFTGYGFFLHTEVLLCNEKIVDNTCVGQCGMLVHAWTDDITQPEYVYDFNRVIIHSQSAWSKKHAPGDIYIVNCYNYDTLTTHILHSWYESVKFNFQSFLNLYRALVIPRRHEMHVPNINKSNYTWKLFLHTKTDLAIPRGSRAAVWAVSTRRGACWAISPETATVYYRSGSWEDPTISTWQCNAHWRNIDCDFRF